MSIQRVAMDADIRAAAADVRQRDVVNAIYHLQTAMQRAWILHDRTAIAKITDFLVRLRSAPTAPPSPKESAS